MAEPQPSPTPFRIVREGDTSPRGGQRWVYTKATAKAAPTLAGRHLLLKARKLTLPLRSELVHLLEQFGGIEDITLAKSGAFLYVTYKENSAAKTARETLSESTAASVLLGCGDRCRGATVHFCTARDLRAEAAAEAARAAKPLPDGLHLLNDFLDSSEEQTIVQHLQSIDWGTNAGHRRVAHFGHTFSYASRSVDFVSATPALPDWTRPLLNRLRDRVTTLPGLGEWTQPDQLTVNEYQPGQGIAAHVETHSAFEDVLLGISLQSGVTMDFRNCELRAARNAQTGNIDGQMTEQRSIMPNQSADATEYMEPEMCSVWLPPRSLLVLSGTARYGWSHGIAHRMTEQRNGTTQPRGLRYSLTFRKVRPRGQGCRCNFPRCCDAKSVRAASVGRHGQDCHTLQHAYVEQPARALLAQSCTQHRLQESADRQPCQQERCSVGSVDLLLPPRILRAASSSATPGAGEAAAQPDCERISRWVDCICSSGGANGAFVAVLGSCYGGIMGWDERSPGAPTSLHVGSGWFGCHPVQSYVQQLVEKSTTRHSASALITASVSLGPVEAGRGDAGRKSLQCLSLPIRSNSCDAVIALGVLDQLATAKQRERFVLETLRLLRPPQGCTAGGEVCFEVIAAPARERVLTHDGAADLLVPVHLPPAASPGASDDSYHEVLFHLFDDRELEELVQVCASQMASDLEVEILWSAKQRGGGTHACVVRRVR